MPGSFYLTTNHASHGVKWLCRISSFNGDPICFGCAMESLENPATLKVMKCKILRDILEFFLVDTEITRHLVNENSLLEHTTVTILSLLPSGDSSLDHLIFAGTAALVSTLNSDIPVKIAVSDIIKRMDAEDIDVGIKLLGCLLRDAPVIAKPLLDKEPRIVIRIILKLECIEIALSANLWFVLAMLYRNSRTFLIVSQDISLRLIETCTNTLVLSSSLEIQRNVLALLKLLILGEGQIDNIFSFEQRRAPCDKSLVDGLKKMILSQYFDLQTIALQCMYLISNASLSLGEMVVLDKFIQRGTCEFLIELLSEDNESIKVAVLSCLSLFALSDSFFSLGHFVYGIDPLITTLRKSVEASRKRSVKALLQMLMNCFQTLARLESPVQLTSHQLIQCVSLLTAVVKFNDKTLDLLVTQLMQNLVELRGLKEDQVLRQVLSYLRKVGCVVFRRYKKGSCYNDGMVTMERILRSLFSVFQKVAEAITNECWETCGDRIQGSIQDTSTSETGKDCKAILLPLLFDILDSFLFPCFLISHEADPNPNTALMVLTAIDTATSFEDENNERFYQKLARTSFVELLLTLRCNAQKASNNEVWKITTSLLTKTCYFVEQDNRTELKLLLTETLTYLTSTPQDWPLTFTQKTLLNCICLQVHIERYCCPILALLYFSQLSGDPLIPSHSLANPLSEFIIVDGTVESLPLLSRKHVLFVWILTHASQAKGMNNELNRDFAKRLIAMGNLPQIYTHNYDVLRWSFMEVIPYEMKASFLRQYLIMASRNAVCYGTSVEDQADLRSLSFIQKHRLDFIQRDLSYCRLMFDLAVTGDAALYSLCREMLHANLSDPITAHETAGQFMSLIYRCLLFDLDSFQKEPLARILDLLSACLVLPGFEARDNDLKVLCQVLSLYKNHCDLEIGLGILNYVNTAIEKATVLKTKQILSVVLGNRSFLEQWILALPSHEADYEEIVPDSLREKLTAAATLLLANLHQACRVTSAMNASRPNILLDKRVVLQLTNMNECKLLQLALLHFWYQYLKSNGSSLEMFSFVSKDGRKVEFTEEDLLTLQITVQNVIFARDTETEEVACTLYQVLLALKTRGCSLAQQPWHSSLIFFESAMLLSDKGDRVNSVRLSLLEALISRSKMELPFNLASQMTVYLSKHSVNVPKEIHKVKLSTLLLEKFGMRIDKPTLRSLRKQIEHAKNCLEETKGKDTSPSSKLSYLRGLIVPSILETEYTTQEVVTHCQMCIETLDRVLQF